MSENSKPSTSRQSGVKSDSDLGATIAWTSLPSNLDERILDVTGRIQVKANALRMAPHVDWKPYLDAGLITLKDFSFVTSFQETKRKEDRDQLLDYFQDDAFAALSSVIQNVCVVEEIQKFLVMIDDMLWEDMSRISRFLTAQNEPWRSFIDLLSCGDDFVRNISSRIICKIFSDDSCDPPDQDLKLYLSWLKHELRTDNEYLLSVCRCVQRLLKVDKYRLIFYNMNGIFRIIRLLTFGIKPQAQYQLVFCIWMASFNAEVAENLNSFSIIPVLIQLLESCPAEIIKLPRVIMATFRNLLELPRVEGIKKYNALIMIQGNVFKFTEIAKSRERIIQDAEFLDDIQFVENILKRYEVELSTFDEYQLEVRSGRLEWSLVHTSKPFWKENADRLNDNKYELLRILISLLETSDEVVVLSVASYDLGEYMNNYPRGKKVVDELGGKDALLKLLTNVHPMVKYYALRSLQILMLNNYDLLIEFAKDKKTADAVESWSHEKFSIESKEKDDA